MHQPFKKVTLQKGHSPTSWYFLVLTQRWSNWLIRFMTRCLVHLRLSSFNIILCRVFLLKYATFIIFVLPYNYNYIIIVILCLLRLKNKHLTHSVFEQHIIAQPIMCNDMYVKTFELIIYLFCWIISFSITILHMLPWNFFII